MKSLYILLVAIAVSAFSCATKEGAPGPAGEGDLIKQGTISGNLTYVDYQGKPITVPFTYDHLETLTDNKFYYDEESGNYEADFFRRELKDYNNYIHFSDLYGGKANGQFQAPTNVYFSFSLKRVINNRLFEFSKQNSNSEYSITNFTFDPVTGRLFFDYTFTIDPSSIRYSERYDETTGATITGRVDVTLTRAQVNLNQEVLN